MKRIYIAAMLSVVWFNMASLAETRFTLEGAGVSEINTAFDTGGLDAERLVQLYLDRIKAYDLQGPSLNAIITLNPNALETARELDAERLVDGPRSPLHGIPVLLKDSYDTFDLPTTAGSLSLEGSIPPDDAFLTRRLREAGAIILGKTNLYEFGVGANTVSSLGGQTLNPYDTRRIPGGSSGGTGAALAANFAAIGMGVDAGGSIRIPASMNSLVGLRPTMGLTSRDGMIPLASDREIGGPICKTVTDVAYVLDVIAGSDLADPITQTSVGKLPNSYTEFLNLHGLEGARIGIVRQLIDGPGSDPQFVSVVNTAIGEIAALGAQIIDPVEIGTLPPVFQSTYTSFRYDMNNYLASLGDNAPVKSVQEIISSGKYLPALDRWLFPWLDRNIPPEESPQYHSVRQLSESIQARIIALMDAEHLDALLYLTVVQKPPLISTDMFADLARSTILAPMIGFPAISVPAGFTSDGLPVGIELLGRPFSEPTLISLAYSYEQETHHRKPPLSTPPIPGETILPVDIDFNGDYKIDINDLVILIENWDSSEQGYDIGPLPLGDGIVDKYDLEVLMSYWGHEVHDPNLIALWKLDEAEGDIAYDSASGNDAIVMGNAVWQPDKGQSDGALLFDGINDHVTTGSILNPGDGSFSVFAWIKGGAPGQVILSQEVGVDWLLVDEQGYLMTSLTSSGRRSGGPLVSDISITDNSWHRVGFSWDGSNRLLYVDDVEVARDKIGAIEGSDGGLRIGVSRNLEPSTFWAGLIDDVRIHRGTVTP